MFRYVVILLCLVVPVIMWVELWGELDKFRRVQWVFFVVYYIGVKIIGCVIVTGKHNNKIGRAHV